MLGLAGGVLHGGTYHQDWRIGATATFRLGRSELARGPRLVGSEWHAPVPPSLAPTLQSPPEHA
jgi:hypothetical protein